jgi:hypothetical protein
MILRGGNRNNNWYREVVRIFFYNGEVLELTWYQT